MSKKDMQPAAPLRSFIQLNGLSMEEAGAALGVHKTTVSQWLARDEIPPYAGRALGLHAEVAKARKDAADAISNASGPSANRAVVLKGNAEDVNALLSMADRMPGVDWLDLGDL